MTPRAGRAWKTRGVALVATLAALGAPAPALAALEFLQTANRIAIVVGNEDYANVPDLPNAGRDARDIAEMLRGFGYSVHEGYDVTREGFEKLVREALLNVPEGGDVVFYYAGHGIQLGRRNYLLPIDAAFASVYDLPVQSITLDRVIEALAARGATHVAIIDACRENPFPNLRLAADLDATLFETRAGFEVFRTPLNSLVAFSTSPGEVAMDGPQGENSPYTGAILTSVRGAPDESVLSVLAEVRERVHEATGGRQVPWESSTLVRTFSFMGGTARSPGGGVEIAQLAADPGRTTTEGREAAPLPPSVDVSLPLDRTVPLGAAIEAVTGQSLISPAVVSAPAKGTAGAEDDTLVYRPALSETRASGLETFLIEDSLVLEAGPEGARQRLEVSLRLGADDCDIEAGDALDLDGVGLYRLPNEIEVSAALAACRAALAETPGSARFLYQLGRAQQADRLIGPALASFRAAGEAGHTRALTAEAFLLSGGQFNREAAGIPLDLDRATELLERGIAAGDPFAMHARGKRLLREGISSDDRARGFELLERAAELGHTYSMNELGYYFLIPDTDHYLPERGMRYLDLSAARDDIYGYHNLALVALNGLDGSSPDSARAESLFLRAAEGGHPVSPTSLGLMEVRGQRGAVDPVEALRWFDEGLARGDGWGGANGAIVILNGSVARLGPADAAVRAAKAMQLPAPDAAAAAAEILAGLPRSALDRALQMILVDLGEDVAVDGAVGPGTRAALGRALERTGAQAGGDSPLGRLEGAARAYWAARPTRPDLF